MATDSGRMPFFKCPNCGFEQAYPLLQNQPDFLDRHNHTHSIVCPGCGRQPPVRKQDIYYVNEP